MFLLNRLIVKENVELEGCSLFPPEPGLFILSVIKVVIFVFPTEPLDRFGLNFDVYLDRTTGIFLGIV